MVSLVVLGPWESGGLTVLTQRPHQTTPGTAGHTQTLPEGGRGGREWGPERRTVDTNCGLRWGCPVAHLHRGPAATYLLLVIRSVFPASLHVRGRGLTVRKQQESRRSLVSTSSGLFWRDCAVCVLLAPLRKSGCFPVDMFKGQILGFLLKLLFVQFLFMDKAKIPSFCTAFKI